MGEVQKHKPDLKRLFQLEMIKTAGYYGISRDKITDEYLRSLLIMIRKRYQGFMLSDFTEAFELLLCGELDGFLPKDSQGQPDKKVYGELSVEFVLRVLNAYRKRKESRQVKALLGYVKTYTPEQIAKIHSDHVADLIEWADVNKMEKPLGGLGEGSQFIYGQFVGWGLVPEISEPQENDLLGPKTKEYHLRAKAVRRAIENLHQEGKTLKSIIETHEK